MYYLGNINKLKINMVRKKIKKQELKFITQEEIKEKIKNLHLTQRWEKDLDSNFSWFYFSDWVSNEWEENEEYHSIYNNIFKWLDLSWADFSNSEIYLSFEWTYLGWVDFRWTKFKAKIDIRTNFEWADFRWAEYDIQNFTEEQKDQIIFTDEDYEKYQNKLEKENKKLKEITKNTSEKQTNKLTESFEKLEEKFWIEETRWLIISFIAFMSLTFFLTIPILDIFIYEYTYKIIFWWIIVIIWLIFTVATLSVNIIKQEIEEENKNWFLKETWIFLKKWWAILIYIFLVVLSLNNYLDSLLAPEKPIFDLDKNFALIPFWILLSTFLYFSIYQYSKSKKLRIENQNKVALLHWFIALRTDNWSDFDKSKFYNNIANVVFDKVYQEKENNLPVDKIIDLVKVIDKK